MDLELKDKVAIVGGASKGLGRACAQVLADEGVKVAVCSRSRADLEKAAQEIREATGRVLELASPLRKAPVIVADCPLDDTNPVRRLLLLPLKERLRAASTHTSLL